MPWQQHRRRSPHAALPWGCRMARRPHLGVGHGLHVCCDLQRCRRIQLALLVLIKFVKLVVLLILLPLLPLGILILILVCFLCVLAGRQLLWLLVPAWPGGCTHRSARQALHAASDTW